MKNKFFIISLSFGLAIYVFAILYIPDFITDDYLIFTYISQHPVNPIALDPNIEFFLFTRPLSYFTFWLDFQLFNNNAVLMKFESLFLFILSVILMYYTLKLLFKYIKIETPKKLIMVGTLIYLFHPDSLMMNVWVANRTELLNILFYLLAFLLFLKFFEKNRVALLVISICSFLLGILSKQSGLHLPLILLIVYSLWLKNKAIFDRKAITYYFIVMFSISILFGIFNLIYGNETLTLALQSYWKKPFSLIGISLLVIQPLIGEIVYSFFLLNKFLAIVLLILLSIATIIYAKKHFYKLKKNNKLLISVTLIYLISFYPRLSGWGVTRINSVQIFWMIVLVLIFGSYFLSNLKLKFLLLTIIAFNISNLFFNIINEKHSISFTTERVLEYLNVYKNDSTVIITDPDIIIIPYLSHFLETGDFGDDEIYNSSIYYSSINPHYRNLGRKMVLCRKLSNSIKVESLYDKIYLLIENRGSLRITESLHSPSGRGYSSITFNIPPHIIQKKFVYFDGEKWQEL